LIYFSAVWPIQWNTQARFFDCCNGFIDFIVRDCSFNCFLVEFCFIQN